MNNVSFWEKSNLNTDFLIIGGGFLGSWTAYEIKKKYPTAKVIVVERDTMSYGASIRDAGLASFGSVTAIMSDISNIGITKTYDLVESRYRGVQKIKSLFQHIDYQNLGAREFLDTRNAASAQASVGDINKEMKRITGREQTFESMGGAQFFNADEGLLNSYKLLCALHERCRDVGVVFCFGMSVDKIDSFNTGVYVLAKNAVREQQYFAKKVIVCTNAYIPRLVPNAKVTAQRHHVLVTSELPLNLNCAGYMFEGGVYFRPLNINAKTHLLIGGGQNFSLSTEQTDNNDFNGQIVQFLQYIANKYISSQPYKIINQWLAFMGCAKEPGNVFESYAHNTYYAASCNAQGVAACPILAENIVKQL